VSSLLPFIPLQKLYGDGSIICELNQRQLDVQILMIGFSPIRSIMVMVVLTVSILLLPLLLPPLPPPPLMLLLVPVLIMAVLIFLAFLPSKEPNFVFTSV
ncbi:hypothetical protein OWV82_019924, partial [Melia azedarach]